MEIAETKSNCSINLDQLAEYKLRHPDLEVLGINVFGNVDITYSSESAFYTDSEISKMAYRIRMDI